MKSITAITSEIKSCTLIKSFMVGVIAAAGFGFVSLSAKADEIIQKGVQTSIQEGNFNTSVQQLNQNAESEAPRGFYRDGHYGYGNTNNIIRQDMDQFSHQKGDRNTSVQQSDQDARIRQEQRTRYFR